MEKNTLCPPPIPRQQGKEGRLLVTAATLTSPLHEQEWSCPYTDLTAHFAFLVRRCCEIITRFFEMLSSEVSVLK